MTKTKNIKTLLILLFTVLVFALSGFFFSIDKTTHAQEGELITQNEIKNSYFINDTLTVSESQILINGNSYDVDSVLLTYPNGLVKQGQEFYLDQNGNYELLFTSGSGENQKFCKKEFIVNTLTYSIPGNSSCEYVENLSTYNNGTPGYDISIANGSEFVYNKPLNLTDLANGDIPLIKFLPYQYSTQKYDSKYYFISSTGQQMYYDAVEREAKTFVVRLTDCYDKNIYVDIEILQSQSYEGTKCYLYPSFAAKAFNQEIGSISQQSTPSTVGEIINVDGVNYLYKTKTFASNYVWTRIVDNGEISIYLDPGTMRLYFSHPGVSKRIFADLKSEEINKELSFEGFTSEEVYLSVFAKEFTGASAHLTISEIGGDFGESLNEPSVTDNVKPQVLVDMPLKSGESISVAQGSTITLPTAKCFDVNSFDGKVDVSVYYAYGSSQQTQIDVVDNKVLMSKYGDYVVSYVATDKYGNKSEPFIITLRSIYTENGTVINADIEELEDNLSAGSTVTMPTATFESFNNYVQYKSYLYLKDAADDKIYFDAGDEILFDEIGTYVVVYEYSEYIEKHVYSYEINVVSSNNVVFSTPTLPKYLIKNSTNTLDEITAVSFEGQKRNVDITYYVSEDDKAFEQIDRLAYKVNANDSVQFKFVAENGNFVLSEKISVIDVGFDPRGYSLQTGKYFVGNFDVKESWSSVYLKSKVLEGENSFEFINPVSVSNFEIFFKALEELDDQPGVNYSNFSEVQITLTDYYDRSKTVSVGLVINDTLITLYANDQKVSTTANFKNVFTSIYYNANTGTFNDMTGKSVAWINDFTSDKAFMTVTLKNITGNSALEISQICNQTFSRDSLDMTSAVCIQYDKQQAGVMSKGDVITVSPGYAIDILSPFCIENLKVSVKNSSGYVRATDGTLLDGTATADKEYQFIADEYDTYLVSYIYSDAYEVVNGGNSSSTYKVYVIDDEAPKLTLENNYNENTYVKVGIGEVYKLAGYSCNDNKATVDIYVMGADLYMQKITHEGVVLRSAGEYKIMYYCYDAEGNTTIRYYNVVVK